MDNQIVYKGIWWLPENPTIKVAGILSINKDTPITLDIIDNLGVESIFDFTNSNTSQKNCVIWGESSESTPISIFGNFSNMFHNLSCSFPLMKFNVKIAVVGSHVESLEKVEPYDVKAKFHELSYWFRPNCIHEIKNDDGVSFSIRKDDCNKISVPLSNGCDLQLKGESKTSCLGSGMSVNMEQWSVLIFSLSSPISILEAKKLEFLFEQFLSLATLSCVQYSHFWLKNKETGKELEIFENNRPGIRKNTRFQDYLFDYDTIKESFPVIIRNWYEKKNLSPIRKHLIDSIITKGYFEANDFLIVCQAIEGYYLRFVKEEKFEMIFKNLINEFSNVAKLEINEQDIPYIKDSRNYFSHLLPPGKKLNVLDGMDLLILNHKMRKLLICCVLRLIGFSNEEINCVFNNSNNYYLDVIKDANM